MLREKEFNEPMDGIVYGVVASLGFATYENYDYVLVSGNLQSRKDRFSLHKSIFGCTHAWFKWMYHGILFGKFVFTGKRFLSFSLIFPFLFHGAYNFWFNQLLYCCSFNNVIYGT